MRKKDFLVIFISLIGMIELFLIGKSFYYHWLCMDHAEHLHASWLVWQGNFPYRDFFEHHNPLLWYILAPVVALFYNNALILYVSRFISVVAYVLLFFVFYKISNRFMKVSLKSFILAILIYFYIPDSYFLLTEMHPDVFMLLSYFIGIYYYYSYLDSKKQKYLNISFIMFAISFLFLQKILLVLFFTGMSILYFIVKKDINIKSVLKASIYPIVIIGVFIAWLYYNGALKIYYQLNYDLNLWMQHFMGDGKTSYSFHYALYLPILSLFMIKNFLADKNKYKNIFIFIALLDYVLKPIVGAPYCQYYILNNLTASLVIGYYIIGHITQHKAKIIMVIMTIIGFVVLNKFPQNKIYPAYYQMNKYIYSQTNKDDVLISSINFINIYGKDASYYWFGLGNIAPVAYYLYMYQEPFVLKTLISKYKPKFIFYEPYENRILIDSRKNGNKKMVDELSKLWHILPVKREDKESFIHRWSLRYYHTFDNSLILREYMPTPFMPPLIMRRH
jgi:hypothetical protein